MTLFLDTLSTLRVNNEYRVISLPRQDKAENNK